MLIAKIHYNATASINTVPCANKRCVSCYARSQAVAKVADRTDRTN